MHPTRLPIIDILRGWALLAVVLVNYAIFFSLDSVARIPAGEHFSRVLKLLVQVFFQAKGWTLLAFLFGYGFSVLIGRLRERSPHPAWAFSRRMFWLLVIAAINCALYYGDVLKDYVLVGMIILMFQRVSARTSLLLALVCLLAFPALIAWSQGAAFANPIAAPAIALYQSHALSQVLSYGLLSGARMLLSVGKYCDWDLVMLACAFAGVYCQRSGFFETLVERRRQIKFICLGALAFAVVVACFRALDAARDWQVGEHYDTQMWPMLGQMVCFTAAICWLHVAGRAAGLFAALRRVGQMTLTNYLLQNLIGMLVFSGFGLGLLHRLPYWAHIVLALAVFAAQMRFSAWWLARHELGPVEYLWRRLSGGRTVAAAS